MGLRWHHALHLFWDYVWLWGEPVSQRFEQCLLCSSSGDHRKKLERETRSSGRYTGYFDGKFLLQDTQTEQRGYELLKYVHKLPWMGFKFSSLRVTMWIIHTGVKRYRCVGSFHMFIFVFPFLWRVAHYHGPWTMAYQPEYSLERGGVNIIGRGSISIQVTSDGCG